jgi:hypothetical protein
MSIISKFTVLGMLCGMLAIAPTHLGWAQAQSDCPDRCPPGQHPEGAVLDHSTGCLKGGICRPDSAPSLPDPTTNVGQAMVSVGNYVYLFAVNPDHHVLYTFWQLGGGGAGWHDMGGDTDTAPAAAAVGNYVFVTIKDRTSNRILMNQGTASHWIGWR